MTFSIVAFDPKTRDLGIAVESKFVCVGAVVPWAKAGVGAIATQSYANTTFGPRGLRMLGRGLTPRQTISKLLSTDVERDQRQIGIVDARGRTASFTGKGCFEWAGHIVDKNYSVQGNILAGEAVLSDMSETYQATEGDMPVKLLAALKAGQRAGGDKRGQQSAALLVVRNKGGYSGYNDRWIDIRVDEHPRPIDELERIFGIYDITMLNRDDPRDVVKVEGDVARTIQEMLKRKGFYRGEVDGTYGEATKKALEAWFGMENFENKWREDDYIWGTVWRYIEEFGRY